MNFSFLLVIAVSASFFIFGAIAVPDELFLRILSFWSLAMSLQIVILTWRPALAAAISKEPSHIEIFALGLMLVNFAILVQRFFGFAVRDFGRSDLITSDLFSGIIALMLAGQALKYSAIEDDGSGVRGLSATVSILRAFAVGMFLAILYDIYLNHRT